MLERERPAGYDRELIRQGVVRPPADEDEQVYPMSGVPASDKSMKLAFLLWIRSEKKGNNAKT